MNDIVFKCRYTDSRIYLEVKNNSNKKLELDILINETLIKRYVSHGESPDKKYEKFEIIYSSRSLMYKRKFKIFDTKNNQINLEGNTAILKVKLGDVVIHEEEIELTY